MHYNPVKLKSTWLFTPKDQRRKLQSKILSTTGQKICSICKMMFVGFGHNPRPVSHLKVSDRCCDDCNNTVVVPLRFKTLNKEIN